MTHITIAMSVAEYNRLEAGSHRHDMVSCTRAAEMFDVSPDYIKSLADSGKLKRYAIPDSRIVRYKVSDLQNLFKPI